MPPISEGERVFPDLPEKVNDVSLRACLGRLLSEDEDNTVDLYNELGPKGYVLLARPLKELVDKDIEYAQYVHSLIDRFGKAKRQKIKTYEEWETEKRERQKRIETLTARTIFKESSDSPQAGTGDKLVYGE